MRQLTQVISMSSETSPSSRSVPARIGPDLSDRLRRLTVGGIRATVFWAAVLLPLAYVPAAYGVMGFDTTGSTLALVAIHAACIVVGHGHNTPPERARS